jgi:hypothetical protein
MTEAEVVGDPARIDEILGVNRRGHGSSLKPLTTAVENR